MYLYIVSLRLDINNMIDLCNCSFAVKAIFEEINYTRFKYLDSLRKALRGVSF